jgi:ABC-2 type transport system ATP-binding protein
MVDGRLAAMGHISEIRAAMSDKPRRVYIETDQTRRLGSALIQLDGVVGIELDEDRLTLQVTDAQGFARGIPKILADGNYDVTRIEPTDESLESVFRYLVEGE